MFHILYALNKTFSFLNTSYDSVYFYSNKFIISNIVVWTYRSTLKAKSLIIILTPVHTYNIIYKVRACMHVHKISAIDVAGVLSIDKWKCSFLPIKHHTLWWKEKNKKKCTIDIIRRCYSKFYKIDSHAHKVQMS